MSFTKYNGFLTVIFYGGFVFLTSCGGLKVGLDDETLDVVECATGQSDCDDATQNASSDSSSDDEDSDTTEHTANYEGSNDDDETTGGGVTALEPDGYDFYAERYFMGTYQLGTRTDGNYNGYLSPRCSNDYNFPMVIRGYSHNDDNFIDYETNTGELAWIAEIYPDDTFDFSVSFLDTFGHPSIQLNCTCEIVPGYQNYYEDEIQCACGGDDSCNLYYMKI